MKVYEIPIIINGELIKLNKKESRHIFSSVSSDLEVHLPKLNKDLLSKLVTTRITDLEDVRLNEIIYFLLLISVTCY